MAISWQIDALDNGLRVVTTPVPTAQSFCTLNDPMQCLKSFNTLNARWMALGWIP